VLEINLQTQPVEERVGLGVRTKYSDSACRGELVLVFELNLQTRPVEESWLGC
jgi:hypothetical protein